MGEYSRSLPYDLMTFDERDQVDAERTDVRKDRVQPARATRYPTLRSPPPVKIIDRVKTYIRQKKERDPSPTENPLDAAAEPTPAQSDRAEDKQNLDDEASAASTAPETAESEPATEPATESAAESVTEPAAESAAESAEEPAEEPAVEPATESAEESETEPAAEPATEPATEPAAEPATAPAACPRCGATGDAPCTTPSGKATKTHKGREQ